MTARKLSILTALVLFSVSSFPVFAFLGEIKERGEYSAQSFSENSTYQILEHQNDGQLIKEYIRSDGIVFAVSWKGVQQPDLSEVLGSYYPPFKSGMKSQASQRPSQKLARSQKQKSFLNGDLVIEYAGRQRNIMGHVFVRSLMPQGVNIHELW